MDQGLDKKANIDLAGLICDLDAEKMLVLLVLLPAVLNRISAHSKLEGWK